MGDDLIVVYMTFFSFFILLLYGPDHADYPATATTV